jgi:uncharacterized protein VirK/YbjX
MRHPNHSSVQLESHAPDFLTIGKIALGCVSYPIQTYKWLHFLRTDTVLANLDISYPQWLARIHRPYVSNRLTCADRVDLLIGHYQFVFGAGLAGLVKKAAVQPVMVCEFTGRSGSSYLVSLTAIDANRADGEMSLRLISQDVCIYTVTFICLTADGKPTIKIGGLYGLLATDDTMRIKRITRDLHGCRPKDLMVAIVREVGNYLGCEKALLTGNKNKVHASGKRICKKSSDYDQTWKEMDAVERADGDFELPCALPASPSETLADAPDHQRWHSSARSTFMASVLATIHTQLAKGKFTSRNRTSTCSPAKSLQEKTFNAPVL